MSHTPSPLSRREVLHASALAALAMGLGCVLPALGEETKKIPVILDTDIGDDIDDTWALALLLRSPMLDLKLVTTTCGKAEYRAKIIAKFLAAAGRSDIPVGLGEGGRTGNGGQLPWVKDYQLSEYAGGIRPDGAGAIVDLVNHSPEPITLIAIGPLHTLAEALRRDAQIPAKANFVGLYGSVRQGYDGTAKLSAEWNVKANPPAAQRVLGAPWRQIVITPLDTCGHIHLTGKRFETLKQSTDPLAKTVLENYRIWSGKPSVDVLKASSTLFDTAAVYLAYPGEHPLMKLEKLPITVTNDGFTRIDPAGASMSVATQWTDLEAYEDLLVSALTREGK